MEFKKYISALFVLNALAFGMNHSPGVTAQEKEKTSQRGGQAGAHMSVNALANTNAQWSADPERGWVRAEERHNQTEGKAKPKQTHGKQKANSGKE